MGEHQTKWMAAMVAKYGSEDAVRAEMKRRQEKSMQNPNRQKGKHKGGFNYMTPEKFKEVTDKGRQTQKDLRAKLAEVDRDL